MKWVIGGPELPPELLQALEDSRLVLFCGAGVSYPAGLPDFRGLVKGVYGPNGRMTDLERAEFKLQNYDRVFGLLETRIGPHLVRRAVIDTLRLESTADVSTHGTLLRLATDRNGVCRLVTTNFDRGFELAAKEGRIAIDSAPKLPVPKLGVWNSMVHLHGRISDVDPEGRSLVLTSADFGAAYLTERWASRFLSELFRRFTVLFVGYSVGDPVVRYMMDAFAADRAVGEGVRTAYVLAPTTQARRAKDLEVWEAKGVAPLHYKGKRKHNALHRTLAKWAECHRNGLLGKEGIIQQYGSTKRPTRPFEDDPVVSQVLWAISEPSGHVAGLFARLDPPPHLDWLAVFEERGLLSLAVNGREVDKDARWSVPLADGGGRSNGPHTLHPVTRALGEWLARQLHEPEVLNWVLRSGASLHPEFRRIIRRRLKDNPAMPQALRQLWRVLAAEAAPVWTNVYRHFFDLQRQLSSEPWTLQVKQAVLDALTPVLELRPSIHQFVFPKDPRDDTTISHFAEVEVVPRCGQDARMLVEAVSRSADRNRILAELADDATGLLKRAMELHEMTQMADAQWDRSYSDQPSMLPHPQNSRLRDWTVLLELCGDAWTALLDIDPERARRLVERWRSIPYPVFRRLCFYAMAGSDLYAPSDCLAYLLEEDGCWLWSIYVYREKFRLLDSIWPNLGDHEAEELISRILTGPPRYMFRDNLADEAYERISDREMWLHLAKLKTWGRELPVAGVARLEELRAHYPQWQLREGDRDEFTMWMEGHVGEPPVENADEFLSLPDDVVIARLTSESPDREKDVAKWHRLVSVQPSRASGLLAAMAETGHWPADVWRAALDGYAAEKRSTQEWPPLIAAIVAAPGDFFGEVLRSLAWLLHEVSPSLTLENEPSFWDVWDRIQPYAFTGAGEPSGDPVTAALNTPSGYLTQALLDRLTVRRPHTATDVPTEIWQRVTALTDGEGQSFQHARVLLSSRLAWFHMVNPALAEGHLLRYFDWNASPEAAAVWQGYLWQARVTPELWVNIKRDFLAALSETGKLGKAGEQLCWLFAQICIDQPDWLTTEEMQAALRSLLPMGRPAVAHVIWKRLEAASEQGEALWTNLIGPWLERIWPKDRAMRDPDSALHLAMAATYAGCAFASAVNTVAPLLSCAGHYSLLVERLLASGYPTRDPIAALQLIDLIVDTNWQWPDPSLRELLDRLREAQPVLADEPRFRHLDEYLRQHDL